MTEETGKNSPKDESYTNILYISKMRKVIFLSLLRTKGIEIIIFTFYVLITDLD